MGFEAMPQIADLEIAATWDEIELEAALRSHGAAAPEAHEADHPSSSLAETLGAIEALKRLPRDERKRRAEELLRALTSAPPASTPTPELTPADTPPSAEPVVPAAETSPPSGESPASVAQPAVAAAPVIAAPTPDTTGSTVGVEPVSAPAPLVMPAVSSGPDAIPKFLATECAALEPEHPDSLIPFRAAVAAGALVFAVLLIYFGSSREFGVAARPVLGPSEIALAHREAPMPWISLAARQAFVALPPEDATGPEPAFPRRPALVGFDLMDDPAQPPIAVKADTAPTVSEAVLVVPPAPTEETTAPPPPAGSEIAALIKRGDDLLKAGDIAAARSAYERAASGGSAKAEIGVGKTYDPLVLSKLGARGVRGDPVQAAAWYARAGEAGDAEGPRRLHALISGLSDCMRTQGTCANPKP